MNSGNIIVRRDNAPVKRVELHCHTKMSRMDGVSSARNIIDRARSWGHKAVAITDFGGVQAFPEAYDAIGRDPQNSPIKVIYGMELRLFDEMAYVPIKGQGYKQFVTSLHQVTLLAKNETGRRNLYKLVSKAHLGSSGRIPVLHRLLLSENREGLLVGSGGMAGKLPWAILDGYSDDTLAAIVDNYDYLEIQPAVDCVLRIDIDKELKEYLDPDEVTEYVLSAEDVRKINRRIVSLGEQCHKPVCATGDVHFLDPEDALAYRALRFARTHESPEGNSSCFLRTTEEMLDEFSYLGKEKAYEVVVTNTNRVAGRVEKISPLYPGRHLPELPHAEEDLIRICYEKAHSIYGDPLPEMVETRLKKELDLICGNGYAVIYLIAQKLVTKSLSDGYIVGFRGSVGSSLAAFMAGIAEVNPLPPHYYCPNCHYVDFDSAEVRKHARESGFDMPDRVCPKCGQMLEKDGFNIPFETFFGLNGEKEPDIDLNVSGDEQGEAFRYMEEICGKGQTFRAGTIGTISDRTAYRYVRHYCDEKGIDPQTFDMNRAIQGCIGVLRTTGQHPGGVIVVPKGMDINWFTPVQHPADDMTTDVITTHLDYRAIAGNLLKFNILGHDDPTMLHMLQMMTGVDPHTIPLDDKGVFSLFSSTEALCIRPDDIGGCDFGTLGLPEFENDFAMDIIQEAKPEKFSDLVRISLLQHGTNTWLKNAQDFTEDGDATLDTVISSRDDIMLDLMSYGIDRENAYEIMESVRKGHGLSAEMTENLQKQEVPEWYMESCDRIRYLFPKAHAAGYVMMAFRIAFFKLYYPLAFYAAYFTIRGSGFSYEKMCRGPEVLAGYIADCEKRIHGLTRRERAILHVMYLCREMYARGFKFMKLDLFRAKAHEFQVIEGMLMPSIDSIDRV